MLENNKIIFKYAVENIGYKIFRGFLAFHGLIAIDESSEISIDVSRVLNVHESKFLGKAETICNYPEYNNYKINKFLPKISKNTEKFYLLDKINSAGLTLNHNKLLYKMNFENIPYFGIWKNEGGFKGECNCALEPSNGFYDSLIIAKKYNKYITLKPHEKKSWELEIELINLT